MIRRAAGVLFFLCCAILAGNQAAPSQQATGSGKYGYPAGSKLLMIHADDIALARSVDAASFEALDQKAASSGSIMVPCPWLTEVGQYAQKNPQADLGIHLTLTSEWNTYRWGPLSPVAADSGLVDPTGFFWADAGSVASKARPAEIEREIRTQIDRAIKAGIQPTHVDSHMGTAFTPAAFPIYVKVAREYKLPFFAIRLPGAPPEMLSILNDSDVVFDSVAMADARVRPESWKEFYIGLIRSLKPGLTLMIVHLGRDDAELQAITVGHPAFGSAWRQRDFEVITSPEFKKALQDNDVRLVGWRDLTKAR
jgi:predicted glycoside hydrolase/deacetylase ChbG (UPF0249 family)